MRPLHDLDALEWSIIHEIKDHACQSAQSVAQLSRAVRYLIENEIDGDFVECGVFMGASVVCMIRTIQDRGALERNIWLYDTFQGMPEQDPEVDVFYDPSLYPAWEDIKNPQGGSNWVRGPIDQVRQNVNRTGYPADLVHYVVGMVEETIPDLMPERIALLRLDTDYYSSTKHEMEHLFPLVVPGGVVIIDDYGAFAGARKAVDEYIRDNGLKVLLSRIDEHVRMWVKT